MMLFKLYPVATNLYFCSIVLYYVYTTGIVFWSVYQSIINSNNKQPSRARVVYGPQFDVYCGLSITYMPCTFAPIVVCGNNNKLISRGNTHSRRRCPKLCGVPYVKC